jgi:hypothetical protein
MELLALVCATRLEQPINSIQLRAAVKTNLRQKNRFFMVGIVSRTHTAYCEHVPRNLFSGLKLLIRRIDFSYSSERRNCLGKMLQAVDLSLVKVCGTDPRLCTKDSKDTAEGGCATISANDSELSFSPSPEINCN